MDMQNDCDNNKNQVMTNNGKENLDDVQQRNQKNIKNTSWILFDIIKHTNKKSEQDAKH